MSILAQLIHVEAQTSPFATNENLAGSIDIQVVKEAQEFYMDFLVSLLNNIKIPDIIFPNNMGYLKQCNLTLQNGSNMDI